MDKQQKPSFKTIFSVIIIVVFFVLFSYMGNSWATVLTNSLGSGVSSMVVYVSITILAIVIAPISTIPLIPIAMHMWGPFVTALLSIFGWTVGAQIAFWLARVYGKKFIHQRFSIQKLKDIKKRFPNMMYFGHWYFYEWESLWIY